MNKRPCKLPVLCDVNVLLSLVADRLEAHHRALAWFERIEDYDQVIVCRVVQLGLLRQLSNPAVMQEEALSLEGAIGVWHQILQDSRVRFEPIEPVDLDDVFVSLVKGKRGHNLWTDAYLAAYAVAAGSELVTFDKGFRRFPNLKLHLLS